MDNQNTKKAAEVFAHALAASLAEALTQATGAPLRVRIADRTDPGPRQGKVIHFRLSAEGGLRGHCFVELYEPEVASLGSRILGRPAEAFASEHTDAFEKVMSAAVAGLIASLSDEWGDVVLRVERVADLAFGGMLMVPLSASFDQGPAMPMLLYFDGQFLRALSGAAKTGAAGDGRSGIDPANLKLVMDVELVMSLRFGQRQLPLREVLELANGSVVELDRQVDDPVELLLDGKVIARGEAVIVDGNYGLRVTEVPQPIASQLGY